MTTTSRLVIIGPDGRPVALLDTHDDLLRWIDTHTAFDATTNLTEAGYRLEQR